MNGERVESVVTVHDMETECSTLPQEVNLRSNNIGVPNATSQSDRPLATASNCSPSSRGGVRKRVREGDSEEEVVEKRGCEEGMSWWMCLMLGMDQANTKPQVVKKIHK